MSIRASLPKGTAAPTLLRCLVPLLVAIGSVLSGCSTSTPVTGRSSLDSSDLRVREFAGDARFRDYLATLSVFQAEYREHVREAREEWWRRIGPSLSPEAADAFDAADFQDILIAGEKSLGAYTGNLEISAGSITNNQEIGVDEGDIAKRVGNHLVVLRRGRLFSFEIGESSVSKPRLVDRIDIPVQVRGDGREIDAWYDEMLVDGSTIVVIGYSYGIEATEIDLFRLSPDGRFSRVDSIFLSSFDYYDTSNYASRLLGGDLILYAPTPVELDEASRRSGGSPMPIDAAPIWPMRVFYSPDGAVTGIAPLVIDSRIFVGVQSVEQRPILHAIVRCPLDAAELRCSAIGVLGPDHATHYISRDAFYLWLTGDDWILDVETVDPDDYRAALDGKDPMASSDRERSVIYRIPLDLESSAHAVGAVEVRGNPNDQFALRERESALDVFSIEYVPRDVHDASSDDEAAVGHLIEIPLADFRPDLLPWSEVASQRLPVDDADGVVNRFVGEHLIYANCDWWNDDGAISSRLRVKSVDPGAPLFEIELDYGVTRIENAGGVAVIVGSSAWSPETIAHPRSWLATVELDETPTIVGEYSVADRFTDLDRSHAFNFSPRDSGKIVALPLSWVAAEMEEGEEWEPLTEIHYFQVAEDLGISPLGAIAQSPEALSIDDHCIASCDDWYGSARPFFVGSRIFGLIDYELVEAEVSGSSLREIHRASAITDQPD